MSTQALIQATALNRYYGNYHAVVDFNLTLHKGEVLGLLGPNGAGKSTTMQMLTGNISPNSGDIIIKGIDLINESLKAKSNIGYLPEQPPVYRDMTPTEFLNYCASLHDIPQADRVKSLENSIERCGLGDVKNKLIANLSKGYQQRVGIAQAILHQPKLVILDEPTVGLDPIQITQIRALIRELGNDHSVILSTHILPEVQAVCDRVQIINRGKTVFADSVKQLSQQSDSSIIVSFSEGGDQAILSTINGVERVELLSPNRYQLYFTQQHSKQPLKPEQIFKLAVEKGWVINELRANTQTLEQIFTALIHSDVESVSDVNDVSNEKSVKKGGGGHKPEITGAKAETAEVNNE